MDQAVAGFEWDAGNRGKCQKHGVSLVDIEAVFRGPMAVFGDPAHSTHEERLKAIGRTGANRYVLVVFTLRDHAAGPRIRPVSARYMHRNEVAYYEKAAAQAEQR